MRISDWSSDVCSSDLGPLLARLDRPLGHPEQADVVVALGIAGDLDELRHTFAPAVERLDPGARSALVVKVEIDVAAAVAVALHETEAARVLVAEGADLESRPVGQWPPDPLAPAGGQQHSVDRKSTRLNSSH